MVKNHLKRLATPKTWNINKKLTRFITRPKPGAHPLSLSQPISIFLKDAKLVRTTKEAKKLLYNHVVLVDGRRVKDSRFPVGIMDVVSIPSTKQNYRIVFNPKGKLDAIEIDAKENNVKISKITGKSMIKGGKTQLNLSDSRNIIVEKDNYKVGDCLLIEVPSQKIKEHLKLEKGSFVILTSGKHIASRGNIEESEKDSITYKSEHGNVRKTMKEYALVVGKEKPIIKIK